MGAHRPERRGVEPAVDRALAASGIGSLVDWLRHAPEAPPDPERRRQFELELQASLMGPLMALHGTAAQELAACCRRGLQLCMDGEPTEQVLPFLFGLFTFAYARQRIREAMALAELFVSIAERKGHGPGRVGGSGLVRAANRLHCASCLFRCSMHVAGASEVLRSHLGVRSAAFRIALRRCVTNGSPPAISSLSTEGPR